MPGLLVKVTYHFKPFMAAVLVVVPYIHLTAGCIILVSVGTADTGITAGVAF